MALARLVNSDGCHLG